MVRTWMLSGALLLALLSFTLAPAALRADAGGGDGDGDAEPRDPDYVEAVSLMEKKEFVSAIKFLKQVIAKNGQDADAFNLLGYSFRNLGRFEEALGYYRTALDIRPGHRGAHEYLGETYLALGQPDKAREHLKFLDDDCWLPCEEYSDLKSAIERYLAQNRS